VVATAGSISISVDRAAAAFARRGGLARDTDRDGVTQTPSNQRSSLAGVLAERVTHDAAQFVTQS